MKETFLKANMWITQLQIATITCIIWSLTFLCMLTHARARTHTHTHTHTQTDICGFMIIPSYSQSQGSFRHASFLFSFSETRMSSHKFLLKLFWIHRGYRGAANSVVTSVRYCLRPFTVKKGLNHSTRAGLTVDQITAVRTACYLDSLRHYSEGGKWQKN